MIEQAFDDGFHLFALDDGRESDGVTKTFVNDANGGVGMTVFFQTDWCPTWVASGKFR